MQDLIRNNCNLCAHLIHHRVSVTPSLEERSFNEANRTQAAIVNIIQNIDTAVALYCSIHETKKIYMHREKRSERLGERVSDHAS